MTDLMRERIPKDLRQAARIMAETDTFETGQAIMNDAAEEIERLRYVLLVVRGAIDTGLNEPLAIWRDQINIALREAD